MTELHAFLLAKMIPQEPEEDC